MSDDLIGKKFGEAMRELRVSAGYSQEELASEMGLHRTYISMLERGKRLPSLQTVFRLSKIVDILPSKLLKKFEDDCLE